MQSTASPTPMWYGEEGVRGPTCEVPLPHAEGYPGMETTVVKPMAFVKPVAVLRVMSPVMMAAVQPVANEAAREVLAVVQEVVGPDTKGAHTVTEDTKSPVVQTMTVAEKSMAMGADPVMVTAPMNAMREPSPGRRRTWPGKHNDREQESCHGYQLSEAFLHHMSLPPILEP